MARSSSSDDDDGERKQRRDANEATSGNAFDDTRLTPDGIRVLRNEVEQTSEDLLLQVLSVHRYLVDPALKRLLGGDDSCKDLERDVFDVVLSDGQRKAKCILASKLNEVLWRGQLSVCDIMRISDFAVYEVQDGDDDTPDSKPRVICLIRDFELIAGHKTKFLIHQATRARPQLEKDHTDDLVFASATSKRDTELIPVAGERMYYLPLAFDHYTLDWMSDAAERTHRRRYLSNLFAPGTRVIHNIKEISDMIDATQHGGSARRDYPPMIGVVRVKSKATHFGEPDISNPFPFVFHIVLVDKQSAVEIAFFGSMCAKYFATVKEGDLIQLRGYSVTTGDASNPPEQLFFFEHESAGEVFHVPGIAQDVLGDKYWKLLEMTQILPKPVSVEGSDGKEMASNGSQRAEARDPLWLECNFASTLDTQYWSDEILEGRDSFYFDFVGVLSFVGRVCRTRRRKRTSAAGDGPSFEWRWVKVVDQSSSTELIILLDDCSQPRLFRDLQAGDTIMLTKLQWVVQTRAEVGLTGVSWCLDGPQHARSSSFSVLRVNEQINPFDAIEECSSTSFFAKTLVAKRQVLKDPSTGESWLEGDTTKQYQTRLAMHADPKEFALYHGLPVCPVRCSLYEWMSCSGLSMLCERLEELASMHLAFTGRLLSISAGSSETATRVDIEIGDKEDKAISHKATLGVNPVFEVLQPAKNVKSVTPEASKRILETLSPALRKEVLSEARQASTRPRSVVPIAALAQKLTEPNREYLFSTRIYRTELGTVEVEVDAILPYLHLRDGSGMTS